MPRAWIRPTGSLFLRKRARGLAAIVGLALRSLGPLSFRAIHDQGSGGKREARMRRTDQLRATKLRQVARRIKNGSSKARRLSPVKRAAEAERDYRRKRP